MATQNVDICPLRTGEFPALHESINQSTCLKLKNFVKDSVFTQSGMLMEIFPPIPPNLPWPNSSSSTRWCVHFVPRWCVTSSLRPHLENVWNWNTFNGTFNAYHAQHSVISSKCFLVSFTGSHEFCNVEVEFSHGGVALVIGHGVFGHAIPVAVVGHLRHLLLGEIFFAEEFCQFDDWLRWFLNIIRIGWNLIFFLWNSNHLHFFSDFLRLNFNLRQYS